MKTMSDYLQAVGQTGIYLQHSLAEDGWTIAAGTQERSVLIGHDNLEEGPLAPIWGPRGQ